MSVYGNIKEFSVVTLEDELRELSKDDRSCESYIREKHRTAEDNGRYVVKLEVADPRFESVHLSQVSVFLPKGVIDNGLLELDSYVDCGSDSCHLKIAGVDDWFDRAGNGATQIHDNRSKSFTA